MRMRLALLAAFPLHVIPGLEDRRARGHYATWLPQLSEAFAAAADLEIHWLVVTREAPPPEPVSWRGQFFHLLHVPGRLRMLRGYAGEIAAIRRRLARIDPALVHTWGTEGCYGLAGAFCGRPWLLSMQGILREYIRRAPMHPFVWLQAAYEWLILRRAREITVESRWGREVLRRLAPRAQVHLVEYGVQPLYFEQRWTPEPARPRAVFIGTIEPRKGIQDAVAAFADPRLAGMELEIIGDVGSSFARKLQADSPANVRWLGRLSPEETAARLASAWTLVLPTRADTSPNVVKEARVLGLPVVTTPDGGQSDYIEDRVNGFIRAPGDIAGLAEALATVLGNLEKARALGAAKWEEQRAFFRPEETARKFLQLYRQLV
jgi:glycosyltransferase involved in cell wall biosynthesis